MFLGWDHFCCLHANVLPTFLHGYYLVKFLDLLLACSGVPSRNRVKDTHRLIYFFIFLTRKNYVARDYGVSSELVIMIKLLLMQLFRWFISESLAILHLQLWVLILSQRFLDKWNKSCDMEHFFSSRFLPIFYFNFYIFSSKF